jgi:hypothetical protein
MANIIGNGDVPQKQQKIDISQSKPMVCSECGYDVFINGTKFRKLSKLAAGSPQDIIIPFDVLLCGNCGQIKEDLLPDEIKALELKDKIENEKKSNA